MNLELKHLAGYLPYNLKAIDKFGHEKIVYWSHQSFSNTIVGLNHLINNESEDFKPILKPLSKLSNAELIPIGLLIRNIEIFNATYKDKIFAIEDAKTWIVRTGMKPVLSFSQVQAIIEYLYSIHADIYGLIDVGLAQEYKYKNKETSNDLEYF